MQITTVGLDLAKNVFQVHGVNEHGKAVLRKQLHRDEVAAFFANLPACLVGMEACANASANLYSLLQTCLANGIDGYRYLRALLVEMPRARTVEDYAALLPWRLAPDER